MANALYNPYKQSCLDGSSPDLTSVNIKAVAVDTADYTFSAAHNDLADIPAGGRVATSANLTGVTVTDGVLDTNDFSFPSVTGDEFEAIVLYVDTGVEATSVLIGYWDGATSGLPLTPNGNNVDVTVSGSGWFTL